MAIYKEKSLTKEPIPTVYTTSFISFERAINTGLAVENNDKKPRAYKVT